MNYQLLALLIILLPSVCLAELNKLDSGTPYALHYTQSFSWNYPEGAAYLERVKKSKIPYHGMSLGESKRIAVNLLTKNLYSTNNEIILDLLGTKVTITTDSTFSETLGKMLDVELFGLKSKIAFFLEDKDKNQTILMHVYSNDGQLKGKLLRIHTFKPYASRTSQ